jgi:tRNA-binding protein
MNKITYEDFEKIDIRVGRIIQIEDFPEAKKPAYKLYIDFGPEIGIKKSSAQVTKNYTKDDLLNEYVLAVVNFLPKQIGPFTSEVLTLGVNDGSGNVVLVMPAGETQIGEKLY